MKEILIRRVSKESEGVYGVIMEKNDPPFAVTYELPWKDNQKSISCIPPGKYVCKRYSSNKYKNTFEVTDVPNRKYILFHIGNTDSDSKGCLLVGEAFEPVYGKPGIADSGGGYGEFMELLAKEESFNLTIEEFDMLLSEKKGLVSRVGGTKTTWLAGIPLIANGIVRLTQKDMSGIESIFMGLAAIFLRDGIAKRQ